MKVFLVIFYVVFGLNFPAFAENQNIENKLFCDNAMFDEDFRSSTYGDIKFYLKTSSSVIETIMHTKFKNFANDNKIEHECIGSKTKRKSLNFCSKVDPRKKMFRYKGKNYYRQFFKEKEVSYIKRTYYSEKISPQIKYKCLFYLD